MLDTETHWNPIRASAGRRVVAAESHWILPAKWNAAAERDGVRRRVLCGAAGDLFEDWDDVLYRQNGDIVIRDYQSALSRVQMPASMRDIRRRVFETIDATPWIDWIVTTKWPQNVRRMWPVPDASRMAINVHSGRGGSHRENVWLLTSVSDQASADAMVPKLLECRDLVPVLGLSVEPLVGPVDLTRWFGPQSEGEWMNVVECGHRSVEYGINWVIVGGESGHDARPCAVAWIRSIVSQCKASGVPVFVKQLGARPVERYPSAWPNGYPHGEQSVVLSGNGFGEFSVTGLRDKKGGDWNEWPADLRVRQFPEVC